MVNNTGLILNLLTLVINLFTCLIACIIVFGILYYLHNNRMKKVDRVTVILCANIYILIFFYTIILVSFNIQALLGEVYQQDFNSWWCFFLGYIASVFLSTLYWSFTNQALFRLWRIVYSTHIWLQYFWIYIILAPIEFILVGLLLFPVLFWQDIVYLPTERYCNVPYTNVRGILWLLFNGYGTPLLILLVIYIRITRFLCTQLNNQSLIAKQRQDRDILVMRRIFITVILLLILGIPRIVLLIMLRISGQEYPYLSRIEWLFICFSMIGLSLSQAIFTPQLKTIILKKFQQNRIAPLAGTIAGSLQARHNPTTS